MQREAAVVVEARCSSSGFSEYRHASGVLTSDWQVLTALHVVDCGPLDVAIQVTAGARSWRVTLERQWSIPGVARLELQGDDTTGLGIFPPEVRHPHSSWREQLYLQAAYPRSEEIVGIAGHSFGGDSYGAPTLVSYEIYGGPGNLGAAVYDVHGVLVAVHMGHTQGQIPYGAYVTKEMVWE